MSLRPVLYAIDQENVAGCGAQSCVKAVMLVGTPAMWFIAVPVLAWAVWRSFVKRDWRYAVALVGYCAGFLPWFADIDRQMYFFYAATMAPFLVMMIALILGDMLYQPRQNAERRTLGLLVVCFYVAPCDHELRMDVPDPHGPADLAVDVEHADLAAQLALSSASCTLSRRGYPQPWRSLDSQRRIVGCSREHHGHGSVFIGSEALASGAITGASCAGTTRRLPRMSTCETALAVAAQRTRPRWLWSSRDGIITGRAAAALHGAQWVDATRRSRCVAQRATADRASSCRKSGSTTTRSSRSRDLRVTTPARTALDLARHLPRDRSGQASRRAGRARRASRR